MRLPPWLEARIDFQGNRGGESSSASGGEELVPPAGASQESGEGSTSTTETQAPAKDKQESPPQGGGMQTMLLFFLGLVVLMWFFMIAPERRRRREHQARLQALKEKDRIVTMGGVYGVVVGIDDQTVTIRIDEKRGTTMRISKGAVSNVLTAEERAGTAAGTETKA